MAMAISKAKCTARISGANLQTGENLKSQANHQTGRPALDVLAKRSYEIEQTNRIRVNQKYEETGENNSALGYNGLFILGELYKL